MITDSNSNGETDEALAQEADRGVSGQGALVRMMARLKDAIVKLERTSAAQQRKMIWLTWAIVFFTVVYLALAIVTAICHG